MMNMFVTIYKCVIVSCFDIHTYTTLLTGSVCRLLISHGQVAKILAANPGGVDVL